MRSLEHRLRVLEFRNPPGRPLRIIVAHREPGQSREEALAAWRAERLERTDVEIGRVIWVVRDTGRPPDPGERDALPVPVAAAAS
jgi:hypothetical protein